MHSKKIFFLQTFYFTSLFRTESIIRIVVFLYSTTSISARVNFSTTQRLDTILPLKTILSFEDTNYNFFQAQLFFQLFLPYGSRGNPAAPHAGFSMRTLQLVTVNYHFTFGILFSTFPAGLKTFSLVCFQDMLYNS